MCTKSWDKTQKSKGVTLGNPRPATGHTFWLSPAAKSQVLNKKVVYKTECTKNGFKVTCQMALDAASVGAISSDAPSRTGLVPICRLGFHKQIGLRMSDWRRHARSSGPILFWVSDAHTGCFPVAASLEFKGELKRWHMLSMVRDKECLVLFHGLCQLHKIGLRELSRQEICPAIRLHCILHHPLVVIR